MLLTDACIMDGWMHVYIYVYSMYITTYIRIRIYL